MKGMDWQSFKLEDTTFYFVRNHFQSIGNPILLKGGKVLLVNKLIHMHKCQSPKTPTSSPTKILSKYPLTQNRCHQHFHIGYTEFKPQIEDLATNPSSVQSSSHRCNRVSVTNLLVSQFIKSKFPSLCFGLTEFWKLPPATGFGTTKSSISVSLRFRKLPHF